MNHLREIIVGLADAGVDFVVAGGVACVLHGVERFTLDLDVSIALERGNVERFIKVMGEHELVPRVPVPPESLCDSDFRKMIVEEKNALVFTFIDLSDPRKHVDVFLTDDLSFEVLDGACDVVKLDHRDVKIASVEQLLDLKSAIEPPREKDVADISFLKGLLNHE